MSLQQPLEPEVEEAFQKFWSGIVLNPDGTLNTDQVKRELFDYQNFMRTASTVYMHVTGGRVSKINTDASVICSLADDVITDAVNEALAEAKAEPPKDAA